MNSDQKIEELPEQAIPVATDQLFFARPGVGNFRVEKQDLFPAPGSEVWYFSQARTGITITAPGTPLYCNFLIPADAVSISGIYLIIGFTGAVNPKLMNFNSNYAGPGSAYNANGFSALGVAIPYTLGQIYAVDLLALGLYPTISANMIAGISMNDINNFSDWFGIGIEIHYARA